MNFCLDNEELRKEFAALANEIGDYIEQKAAILANMSLQGGSLEVSTSCRLLCVLLQHVDKNLLWLLLIFPFNVKLHFLACWFHGCLM